MASQTFVRSVIRQMEGILSSEEEYRRRLDLYPAIVSAWRRDLDGDRQKMIEEVISTASHNGVALDEFELSESVEMQRGRSEAKYAKACAEAILIACDDFYRETSGFPLPEGRSAAK